MQTAEGKKTLLKYLNIADSSIIDILVENKVFSEDTISKNIPEDVKDLLKKNMSGQKLVKIDFVHGETKLELHEESDGTKKFFWISGLWEEFLQNGKYDALPYNDPLVIPKKKVINKNLY